MSPPFVLRRGKTRDLSDETFAGLLYPADAGFCPLRTTDSRPVIGDMSEKLFRGFFLQTKKDILIHMRQKPLFCE